MTLAFNSSILHGVLGKVVLANSLQFYALQIYQALWTELCNKMKDETYVYTGAIIVVRSSESSPTCLLYCWVGLILAIVLCYVGLVEKEYLYAKNQGRN